MNVRMMFFGRDVVFAFVAATLLACHPVSDAYGLDIPVLEGGYDSLAYQLDGRATKQLSLRVDLPYRATEAYDYYTSYFREGGWNLCGKLGSWEKHSYLGSDKRIKDVERIVTHMWNNSREEIVLVKLEFPRPTGRDGTPHSDVVTQSITIVIYDDTTREELSSMIGLNCK